MNTSGELAYYENLDTRNATIAESAFLKKLHENKKLSGVEEVTDVERIDGIDTDVLVWLAKQDLETQKHVNQVIRHMMAIQNHRVVVK